MSKVWNIPAFNSGRVLALTVAATATLILAPHAAVAADDQVTFSKDIAPIFQRSCQACHRPGSIGPMSLLSYNEARPWARSIKDRVSRRAMPPWFADRTVGIQQFKDDPSLTDQEVATIVKWVDSGAPGGNPADAPPPLKFDSQVHKWNIGEPDLIVPIPEPWVVAAGTPNQWVGFVADTNLTEDRWIKALETKPSLEGFRVVHHASTRVLLDGIETELGEYAQGKNADVFPDGTGLLLKAGSKITFNNHYASNGEAATDRTSVAFKFYPKGYVPDHKIVRTSIGTVNDLDFPAGETEIRHDAYTFLEKNVRVAVVQPHLHNRGKRQCIEAIFKDGTIKTLNCINWDFGWHIAYNYKDEVQPLLPKGTVLHVTSWHDNTAGNKWNPDPKNWVGWGDRSSDDMAFTHISYFELSDAEFAAAVAERKASAAKATNNN